MGGEVHKCVPKEGRKEIIPLYENKFLCIFVELGGGVDDALVWCRDGAYVEFGFR